MRFPVSKNQIILDNGAKTCCTCARNIHKTLSEIPVKDYGLSLPNVIFWLHSNLEIYMA